MHARNLFHGDILRIRISINSYMFPGYNVYLYNVILFYYPPFDTEIFPQGPNCLVYILFFEYYLSALGPLQVFCAYISVSAGRLTKTNQAVCLGEYLYLLTMEFVSANSQGYGPIA